ncbi:MAG: hypothetical protein ABI851_03550 [Saprospiraceae bacterium]
MNDQLQNSDFTYTLSQQWNKRDKKFDLVINPKDQIDESLGIESNLAKEIIEIKSAEEEIKELLVPVFDLEPIELSQEAKTYPEENYTEPTIDIPNLESKTDLEEVKVNVYVPQSGFHTWLNSLAQKSSDGDIVLNIPAQTIKREKITKTKAEAKFETELTPISETLANLLASQGYKEEARTMYEKLSLKFPEKKDIFAPLIEKLKN